MNLDEAYANAAYIDMGEAYPDKWAMAAHEFRQTARAELDLRYGERDRTVFDLFHPDRLAKGLLVFVHGGYWMAFDKSYWSHLAAGALAHGWAVAIPSYDLCPDVRICEITLQIEAAITAAADRVPGPIRLAGHSAGGHLVARMGCADIAPSWRSRVEQIVPISPVAELGPLMQTSMNETLQITREEAMHESPLRHDSVGLPVTVWVGENERPVFLDQARWLADAWGVERVVAPERHHFNVIEDLADPESALVATLLA
ncbi:MAG TPA: alpha/beta hydrolase [Paracoccaceae bacterium]|nr:alpha/beta hydrolase [Paracoccaceae bacterium]